MASITRKGCGRSGDTALRHRYPDRISGRSGTGTGEFARHQERSISVITWMEVMIGSGPQDEAATRLFLQNFIVIAIDEAVREQAVRVRQARRIRLPDAIILASAQVHGLTLVTRDTNSPRF